MACYDCEGCSYSIDCGGKCEHWEYDCPFLTVQKYSSEQLKLMRETVKNIYTSIEKLKELDTEEYMEDRIHQLKFQVDLFEDHICEETEKEWNEIKE